MWALSTRRVIRRTCRWRIRSNTQASKSSIRGTPEGFELEAPGNEEPEVSSRFKSYNRLLGKGCSINARRSKGCREATSCGLTRADDSGTVTWEHQGLPTGGNLVAGEETVQGEQGKRRDTYKERTEWCDSRPVVR